MDISYPIVAVDRIGLGSSGLGLGTLELSIPRTLTPVTSVKNQIGEMIRHSEEKMLSKNEYHSKVSAMVKSRPNLPHGAPVRGRWKHHLIDATLLMC